MTFFQPNKILKQTKAMRFFCKKNIHIDNFIPLLQMDVRWMRFF